MVAGSEPIPDGTRRWDVARTIFRFDRSARQAAGLHRNLNQSVQCADGFIVSNMLLRLIGHDVGKG